ncbi:MAG: cupin domain-containing protein [Thermaerobacter sp.]|nr:cupin domain-containing protein [Thermaerobacter sp.]
MRVLDFAKETAQPVTHYGSSGFALARLFSGTLALHAHLCYLAPGGRIGRHEAASEQLLLVVDGSAMVRGQAGAQELLRAGEAVFFARGEEHETQSEGGMRAVILEGDGIASALG